MIGAHPIRPLIRGVLLAALVAGAATAQTTLPNPLQNAPSSDTPADVFDPPKPPPPAHTTARQKPRATPTPAPPQPEPKAESR